MNEEILRAQNMLIYLQFKEEGMWGHQDAANQTSAEADASNAELTCPRSAPSQATIFADGV